MTWWKGLQTQNTFTSTHSQKIFFNIQNTFDPVSNCSVWNHSTNYFFFSEYNLLSERNNFEIYEFVYEIYFVADFYQRYKNTNFFIGYWWEVLTYVGVYW